MFRRVGHFCATYPWIVCAAWLLVGGALMLVAPNWDTRTHDDDVRFLPERCTSVRAYQILEKAFPDDVNASRLIFVLERPDSKLSDTDFALADRMVRELERLRDREPDLKIGRITSHRDALIGSRLTSTDGQCTLIQVSLGTPFLALQTQHTVNRAQEAVRKHLIDAGDDAPAFYTTGQAGIGRDLLEATGASLDDTTLATILLVVVILLFVYRSPMMALVPLLSIAASVWVSLNLLALMTLIPGVYLVNISKIFAIVILYGAGTDYCLFLISRYREELENGRTTVQALSLSVGSVGGALTASAGTVMCGLGLMVTAEFAKVRYSGPGIALSLAVALLASLTLTPALLRILGRLAFWPARLPAAAAVLRLRDDRRRRGSVWEWISHRVVARPVVVWGLSVALLLPLALLGLQVKPDYGVTCQLAPSSESVRGLNVLKRHFPAGETGPVTVLLVSPHDWDSASGRIEIDHLCRGFARLENVAEVRSLTQPLGKPLPEAAASSGGGGFLKLLTAIQPGLVDSALSKARAAARQHYVSTLPADADGKGERSVTRIDVVLRSDPDSPASAETLQAIQLWLREELPRTSLMGEGLQAETYGVIAGSQDLAAVTESDRSRVNLLIIAGILLILLVIVRRPLTAVYLLLTVLFSYYATLGATMLAGILWSGHLAFELDWRVMFFLFTILVAVGEDYNILLISRALQEQSRYGLIEGTRRALARTGGTISSCGLIMAGTFATLMLARLNSLMQIGFALAFGVLLDTFIVRPFLVPTFAVLFGGTSAKRRAVRSGPAARKPLDRVPPALRMAG